jgi:hypothetical protein
LPGNSTAGRTPPSTNGRVKVEQAISGARDAMQARRRGGVRTRRLLVPVLLALGVIFVLRRFEQSTGG